MHSACNKSDFRPCTPVAATLLTDWGFAVSRTRNWLKHLDCSGSLTLAVGPKSNNDPVGPIAGPVLEWSLREQNSVTLALSSRKQLRSYASSLQNWADHAASNN